MSYIIPSTDVIQLTLTLKMATVVETSVTVNNNSLIQDYVHPDDQTQPTFKNFEFDVIINNNKHFYSAFLLVIQSALQSNNSNTT